MEDSIDSMFEKKYITPALRQELLSASFDDEVSDDDKQLRIALHSGISCIDRKVTLIRFFFKGTSTTSTTSSRDAVFIPVRVDVEN